MARWLASLLVAVIATTAAPVLAATAPAGGVHAANVTQQRENKANPDRWKRGESQSSDDDDDDAAKHHKKDHDEDPPKEPAHRGELNGKLDLGSW
jgi:hypothetical protein